jgi:BirA family transcriptional regulator, biotin operon repressor / biotin---[acetyl-CoA-carboxylase] ligase
MSTVLPLPRGYVLVERESVPSTNDEAARMAAEGAVDGTVVWAHCQTDGRGRRGRQWASPEGNLYCSVLMRPKVPLARAAGLSLVAAVAVGDTVAGFLPAGRRVQHKWPNDVLVEGAKIAGLLLEASGSNRGAADWVVVGCGLNVAVHPEAEGLSATDLSRERGLRITVGAVLVALLDNLRHWRGRWETAGIAPVRDAWLARARGLGEAITVRLPKEELEGQFEGMDETGALVLRLADSTTRTISAGDVFFR